MSQRRQNAQCPITGILSGICSQLLKLFLILAAGFLFPLPRRIPDSVTQEILRAYAEQLANIVSAPAALPPESEHEQVGRTERVLQYLQRAEKKEIDPWLRDDIRIAWITVRWAQYGVPEWSWHRDSPPHVAATYQVLRCHPDQVWPRIVAERKFKLGAEYSRWYDDDSATSPKKACASERRRTPRKKAA